MSGIRGIPGGYPDYPELPEFARIMLGSSENPTSPRKGSGGGSVWGDPYLLCGQGSKRVSPPPLNVPCTAHIPPYTPACIRAPHMRAPRL
eukprot:6084012-Prymnesium_polylepis.1